MTDREKREKVVRGLECCIAYDYKCSDCPYRDDGGAEDGCYSDELKTDALALLKAQEKATIEPKRIELEEETKAWLDKMDAVDALGNIADICIDWDGYRTANGLGGLVNEIWAYARYCANRLLKAQEPVEPNLLVMNGRLSNGTKYICGGCGGSFFHQKVNFCPWCGRTVKWE